MTILLTGASGFVGKALVAALKRRGETVLAAGRSKPEGIEFFPWDATRGDKLPGRAFERADAVINLAGEPVAQRWNASVKERILSSREAGTRAVVDGIREASPRPKVLINASAVGFYGEGGDVPLTEPAPAGHGFLSDVCVRWENEAFRAAEFDVRVVCLRIGVVLGDGGALKTMLPPFRMGVGGKIGTGQQWMPWIHVDDLIAMTLWALDNQTVSGPVNGVGPEPARNSDFTKALGRAIHRPAFMPVPMFALRALYGELADVMTMSQRVIPEVAQSGGFKFRYGSLDEALRDAVSRL